MYKDRSHYSKSGILNIVLHQLEKAFISFAATFNIHLSSLTTFKKANVTECKQRGKKRGRCCFLRQWASTLKRTSTEKHFIFSFTEQLCLRLPGNIHCIGNGNRDLKSDCHIIQHLPPLRRSVPDQPL